MSRTFDNEMVVEGDTVYQITGIGISPLKVNLVSGEQVHFTDGTYTDKLYKSFCKSKHVADEWFDAKQSKSMNKLQEFFRSQGR